MTPKIFKNINSAKGISAIIAGLKQAALTPALSFGITLAMALSLFLATSFYMLWQNINTLNDKWNISAEISLYLKKKINQKDTDDLVARLQSNPVVAKVELIQPDDGMKVFIESTSLNTLLSSFKENPLPNVIIIHPKIKLLSQDMTQEFISKLKELPEIETVKADTEWMNRSYHWVNLANNLSLLFILILTINALLVVIGASYITTRFFTLKDNTHKIILQYQFAWYGLTSSLLALLWVRVISITLQNKEILLQGLPVSYGIFIVLISILLCSASARIGAKLR
ncbi:MAG: permease-like cell division protein FtsX [Gammaproteobacteria bacterium]|nr:permease-like cell division protein FtsX [Gammaproteobacteria bacterium]